MSIVARMTNYMYWVSAYRQLVRGCGGSGCDRLIDRRGFALRCICRMVCTLQNCYRTCRVAFHSRPWLIAALYEMMPVITRRRTKLAAACQFLAKAIVVSAIGSLTALTSLPVFAQAQIAGYATAALNSTSHLPEGSFGADDCRRPDERTLNAIVQIATDHGNHASGIVFDNNRVLTAAHAVQGAGRFFVRVGDDFRAADLVIVDHANDLAVLAVDTALIEPLAISLFHPVQSDPVWAAGYPKAQEMTMSMGVFKQLSGGALHTSATIDSGQSGGGLLSCAHGRWSLVGMLRGYGAYLQGDQYVKLENHSVSVAGTTINTFLRAYQ